MKFNGRVFNPVLDIFLFATRSEFGVGLIVGVLGKRNYRVLPRLLRIEILGFRIKRLNLQLWGDLESPWACVFVTDSTCPFTRVLKQL
jgi:hypothetical protein